MKTARALTGITAKAREWSQKAGGAGCMNRLRWLYGKRRLIVCPEGPRWGVPFESLVDDSGKFLVKRYEIDHEHRTHSLAATINHASSTKPGSEPSVLVIAYPAYGTYERFAKEIPAETGDGTAECAKSRWINRLGWSPAEAGEIKKQFPNAKV
jgi:hypothetical protein